QQRSVARFEIVGPVLAAGVALDVLADLLVVALRARLELGLLVDADQLGHGLRVARLAPFALAATLEDQPRADARFHPIASASELEWPEVLAVGVAKRLHRHVHPPRQEHEGAAG